MPAPNKPVMPNPSPTITVGPLEFRLLHDLARYRNGRMVMTIQDTLADFSGDGVKGWVGAALGGTIVCSINGRLWACRPQALVDAVRTAEKTYTKEGT